MGTFFTGLSGAVGDSQESGGGNDGNNKQQLKIFPAHVIDICMGPSSELYETPKDIGKILFRDLVKQVNKPEANLSKVAYPLDRSFARYPMPGEEVLIYRAMGDSGTTGALVMATIYYYSFVVSALHNVSYNSHPFMGVDSDRVDPSNLNPLYDENKKRFDKKVGDISTVKDVEDKTKVYKQLQPYEGDFILQGRFGNSIRFSSTSQVQQSAWSQAGVSGDGIMLLRVDRDYSVDESSMLAKENIDQDDASIYLCTSQKVEMSLACSSMLKSWKARYNLTDKAQSSGTLVKDTGGEETIQKVIDTQKPITDEFINSPN